jgi:hypothetical protein
MKNLNLSALDLLKYENKNATKTSAQKGANIKKRFKWIAVSIFMILRFPVKKYADVK